MPQPAARDGEILSEIKYIHADLPLDNATKKSLKVGDFVNLSGTVYTARDQAHKRIVDAIECGGELPFALSGAAIYYCGPTPKRQNEIIGSCGPTTSGRMDAYTPTLLQNGLKAMIGKGVRSPAVEDAIRAHGAVYFSAIGGAAALYRSRVTKAGLVAYPDLGCEAVYKLTIKDFPVMVSVI